MNTLGPIAKFAAAIVGKQPADELRPRGFVGLELADAVDSPRVTAVLADSPAEAAGIKPGDHLTRVRGRLVKSPAEARAALAEVGVGDEVPLTLARGAETLSITLTAGEGF